jgi:hypothetical protein
VFRRDKGRISILAHEDTHYQDCRSSVFRRLLAQGGTQQAKSDSASSFWQMGKLAIL